MSAQFHTRYAWARHPTGGVVVDLGSGNYYRVNATAALICDALLAGGDATARVARDLNVSREEAATVIAEVTDELSRPAVRRPPPGAYHFLGVDHGYILVHGDRTVLAVDARGETIRLPSTDPLGDPTVLEFYVRALAPKLLFQRQVMVLHASACLSGAGRLIAFAGLSGAGKTTTARAFAAAGLRLVSEDLLVFQPGDGNSRVALQGETYVQSWARGITERLLENRSSVPVGDLSGAVRGPDAPVETILCLDRNRRAGERLSTQTMDGPDALVALMTHTFLGAREPEHWRRYLAATSALVTAVHVREATAPQGVESLMDAASAYISNLAS